MLNQITKRIGVAAYRIPWVKDWWSRTYEAFSSEAIPWTPLTKPLSQCRFALLTTGGVHLKTHTPFDMTDNNGDPSYRKIPPDANMEDLKITHDYYDHRNADRDLNLVFPIDMVRHYQQEGILGASADFFYSFMGHIDGPHVKTLVQKTAKEVAMHLNQQQVDIALLVPA